jgi:hypothetical protein
MNMASKTEIQNPLAIDSEKLIESAIESNLQMTYEDRIEAHENARQLLIDLQQAGEDLRAKS